MRIARAVFCLLISACALIALNMKMGDVPPLGKFLDPFGGFWANAESRNTDPAEELQLGELRDEVTIRYDRSRIPHIFAKNDHDLYFAQGFVTARDRLWQMDFQTRFASGRLSEVVGAKALELDRYQRRMGMLYGAEKMVAEMDKDPVIKEVIDAYTAGINAYIRTLDPKDYPIEFKILNYSPEEWKPLYCALLLKLMSATLTGGSDEMYMSNALSRFG
ncbi:MAG TPA: penicillin acylase family protein, partial [Sphingobacteriaceae bacterium]